jgi:hypothetical protein
LVEKFTSVLGYLAWSRPIPWAREEKRAFDIKKNLIKLNDHE